MTNKWQCIYFPVSVLFSSSFGNCKFTRRSHIKNWVKKTAWWVAYVECTHIYTHISKPEIWAIVIISTLVPHVLKLCIWVEVTLSSTLVTCGYVHFQCSIFNKIAYVVANYMSNYSTVCVFPWHENWNAVTKTGSVSSGIPLYD